MNALTKNSMCKTQLIDALSAKTARIAVVGLGYVGIPLVLRFTEQGYEATGFDIDEAKVARLNQGQSLIKHFSDAEIRSACAAGFHATTDMAEIADCDVIILCVPTPLTKHREPNLDYVIDTMEALVPYLREGHAICLESTTYPGTTEEELRPRIEGAGLVIGENAFLIYSPEREDPGNEKFSTRSIPKIVGGSTAACLEVGLAIYGGVIEKTIPVSSTQVAELTKLLENIHRAVNIGLVNEMKIVSDRMGIDIREVIAAAATKPFGFVPYYPGPGLGGHCIPIDPFYLTWKAREYGVHTRFIELAGEVNSAMPDYVISKLVMAMNERRKPIRGSSILVLGLAYKRDVDDMRESPSVTIMEKLRDLGAEVAYSDPNIPSFPKMREHHFDLHSIALDETAIGDFDAVILATDHSDFPYSLIADAAQLIIDTRGAFDRLNAKVVSA